MTLVQAYELGVYYPIAIKIMAEKTNNTNLKVLLESFLEYVSIFDLDNKNGQNNFEYFISDEFLNQVSIKLSTSDNKKLYDAWSLGRSVSTLDWLLKNGSDNSGVIEYLVDEEKTAIDKLELNYTLTLDRVDASLMELKTLMEEKDDEEKGRTVIKVDGNNNKIANGNEIQIDSGNVSIKVENMTLDELKQHLDKLDETQKKNFIKKITEHPLFISILGGLAGGVI